MFTGIIDQQGCIESISSTPNTLRVGIKSTYKNLELGESIAIDGACLTVTDITQTTFFVDLSPETLSLTNASLWEVGSKVHLERALCVGGRLGGHWVLGHVDSKVKLVCREKIEDCMCLTFGGVSPTHRSYLVSKGSVALNGVSLTINQVKGDEFSVMLIPHTLKITKFADLPFTGEVNVEYDYLLKWAARDKAITKEECYGE